MGSPSVGAWLFPVTTGTVTAEIIRQYIASHFDQPPNGDDNFRIGDEFFSRVSLALTVIDSKAVVVYFERVE
jgi:hypothetical protein